MNLFEDNFLKLDESFDPSQTLGVPEQTFEQDQSNNQREVYQREVYPYKVYQDLDTNSIDTNFKNIVKDMSDILYKNFLIDKYLLYKTKTKKDIDINDLIECFVLSLQETAIVFGKCTTTIKRILRKYNIKRWPSRFIRGYCRKKYGNTSYFHILKNQEFLLMCKEKFINTESFDLSFDLNNQTIDKSTCNSVVNMEETIQINKIKQNINEQKGVLYNLILKEKQLLDKIVEEKTAKVKQLEDILNDM